jgi:hypothetical protein
MRRTGFGERRIETRVERRRRGTEKGKVSIDIKMVWTSCDRLRQRLLFVVFVRSERKQNPLFGGLRSKESVTTFVKIVVEEPTGLEIEDAESILRNLRSVLWLTGVHGIINMSMSIFFNIRV